MCLIHHFIVCKILKEKLRESYAIFTNSNIHFQCRIQVIRGLLELWPTHVCITHVHTNKKIKGGKTKGVLHQCFKTMTLTLAFGSRLLNLFKNNSLPCFTICVSTDASASAVSLHSKCQWPQVNTNVSSHFGPCHSCWRKAGSFCKALDGHQALTLKHVLYLQL